MKGQQTLIRMPLLLLLQLSYFQIVPWCYVHAPLALGCICENAFWRTMPDELPAGCRCPLSSSSRRRRRAHCKHQGPRTCLGKPPWQPRTASAAAAAPGPISAVGGAARGSAAPISPSTSSRERASGEATRRGVLAVRPRARCLADGRPCGGSGAPSSSSREDFDNHAS